MNELSPKAITVALLVGAAACLVTASIAGAESHSVKKGRFQTIPGLKPDMSNGLFTLGWASDRAWMVFDAAPYGAGTITVTSAMIRGGSLRSFVTTRVTDAGEPPRVIAGSELAYPTKADSQAYVAIRTRPLLANGRAGAPAPEDLNPRSFAPNQSLVVRDGVHVGNRTVWAFDGATRDFDKAVLWACCDGQGEAREFTKLLGRRSLPVLDPHVGLDSGGRLWLSWLDGGQSPDESIRIVELDPNTLAPRTSKALVAPRPKRAVLGHDLACAAICRIVYGVQTIGIFSWAPGERSPTGIVVRQPSERLTGAEGLLAGASYRSGRLVIVSLSGEGLKIAQGDGRGANPKLLGISRIGQASPIKGYSGSPFAARLLFVPAGLLVVQPFGTQTTKAALVLSDFVPLPR